MTGSIDIGELVTYIDWQCVVVFCVIVRVHLSVSSRLRGLTASLNGEDVCKASECIHVLDNSAL